MWNRRYSAPPHCPGWTSNAELYGDSSRHIKQEQNSSKTIKEEQEKHQQQMKNG